MQATAGSHAVTSHLGTILGLVASLLFGATPARSAETPRPPTTAIVRQIDHILIRSTHANELFNLLAETFQFPVAWPMAEYGGFASGGVAVGNVNLEVLRSSSPVDHATTQFAGFALEPEPLPRTLLELDARNISHGAAAPFRARHFFGPGKLLWTTVSLPTVSSESVEVFLCEYDHDLPTRRQRLREELRSRQGGPLAVQSVREIVYGARDEKQRAAAWQVLLQPLTPSFSGAWSVGDGPAIRVRQAERDGIQELTLVVKSLAQARDFLRAHGLLGTDEPATLTLGGSLFEGVRIVLVEPVSVSR
jgi:hypothetical protein